MRILLVEDDEALGDGLQNGLTEFKHVVDWVKDGLTAKRAIDTEKFDVIILDLGLPKISGLELLKYTRQEDNNTPIIILTAREDIEDRVKGLDSGADDYLAKPCDLDELEARIRALHRRRAGVTSSTITRGNLVLETVSHQVTFEGKPINLPRREFAILQRLMENQGRVISREILVQVLYGWEEEIDSNAVEVHIHNLRKKFGNDLIRTIRGVGYMISKLATDTIEKEQKTDSQA